MSARRSDHDVPLRRKPPKFRRVTVRRVAELTPRMRRIVLAGPELDGMEVAEPAASVRLLLPRHDGTLELPGWTGNQFELADGARAPIRTFTPRHHDPATNELTIDVVAHGDGAASGWAAATQPGDEVAVSGPGRGYEVTTTATSYLLAGDESAIPAIDQLLEEFADRVPELPVTALIEVADPSARVALHAGPSTTVRWLDLPDDAPPGTALFEAIERLDDLPEVVWVAGEAASMQRIRKHLFGERGLNRSQATVRGYWKLGRSAT
ncbi:MAG: siderophore-interacting protein [Microthrixaceae bacterium]